ncbi:tetratricopeptide repeat protein [Trichocoleus sp. FACHB-262]|uniref:tetratricopeptide repeat protein n=1 Tax=Trichocoleus sp. FACHB-262 TaxID=2692869 RepID=UPI0016899F0D|nr:tetratricopeptide repeat protein [Trichocoleus sp. FACHB-262]MBD2121353.1 tetratricopeptide repeat protein [Trichocoleus sp. FACHB-262]
MPLDEDPSEANHSHSQNQQTAVSNVTARDIQIGQIVQRIVYLGLPFNSHHLHFVQFLANSAYLTCLIGGFIRLWREGVNFTTLLMIIAGSGLLSVTCLYYARFWRPEAQDKSAPSSELPDSDERVKVQQNKQRSRHRVRRLTMIGVFAIPLITWAGFFVWRSLPAPHVLLLVADFDSDEQQQYQVTETILQNLRNSTEDYADVKVQALNQVITEQQGSEVARTVGEQKKASIVIWGNYGATETNAQFSVHFEVLKPPTYFPKLEKTARGEAQISPISELKSFKVQTRLSQEMSYLTLFTLGMVQYAKEDWDGAVVRFKSALGQVKEPVTTLGREAIYFYIGNSHSHKSDYKNAITNYTESLKLEPDYAVTYYNRGIAYAEQGNYTQAMADYNQSLKLRPDYADAYNNRGNVYAKQGNYTQAIADYSQSLKQAPDLAADAYSNRGLAYAEQGNYTQAMADYNQALKLEPDYAMTYNNRGIAYAEQGNYTQAMADYNQALKLEPDYAEAYYNRGNAYLKQGNYTQAIDDYTQALKLRPDLAEAYSNRGVAYLKQGNYTQAIDDYTQALKLEPNHAKAYYNRGNAYLKQGNYTQAIDDYTQALKLKPDYVEAYNNRGGAYLKQSNYTQAIADYTQALKLKPNHAKAYYGKACTHSLKREVKAAIENLQQAIDLEAKFREDAKTDSNFDNIRQDKQFQILVGH